MKKISLILTLLLLCCACSREAEESTAYKRAKADVLAEEAKELYDDGLFDKAEEKIDKAIRLDPKNQSYKRLAKRIKREIKPEETPERTMFSAWPKSNKKKETRNVDEWEDKKDAKVEQSQDDDEGVKLGPEDFGETLQETVPEEDTALLADVPAEEPTYETTPLEDAPAAPDDAESSEFVETEMPLEATKPGSEAGERMVLTVDGIDYAFRWCPPGEFMMGGDKFDREKPVHKVKLTKGFWMLETEVTQEMWQSVMGKNLSDFKGDQKPVARVSWYDCQEFCKKLSQKLGQQVKLPTEAQWEYACRAGTTGDYAGTLDEMAWYGDNSDSTTHAVGQKKPNQWGLYDMHGNVWEWCSDNYDYEYYAKSPTSDPENTTTSSCRVNRGGGWGNYAENCRSAYRFRFEPDSRYNILGLRVLVVLGQE